MCDIPTYVQISSLNYDTGHGSLCRENFEYSAYRLPRVAIASISSKRRSILMSMKIKALPYTLYFR